jgi:hypothetical protein
MKLKAAQKEIDLVVQPGGMTRKEAKELSDFIEEYKRNRKAKKEKHRKAA